MDLRSENDELRAESHFLVLRVERDVLDWLLEQLTTDEIEEVPLKHQTSPT